MRFPAAAVVRGRIEAPPAVEELDVRGLRPDLRSPMPSPGAGWTFVALPATEVRWTLSGRATVPQRAPSSRSASRRPRPPPPPSRAPGSRCSAGSRCGSPRVASRRCGCRCRPALEVADVRGPSAGWKVEAGTLVDHPARSGRGHAGGGDRADRRSQGPLRDPAALPEGSARTAPARQGVAQGGRHPLADRSRRGAGARGARGGPPAGLVEGGRRPPLRGGGRPARPPLWEAAWAERTEVLAAQVDRLLVDVAMGEAGKASYQLWAEVRNRGAQQLALTLPAGFELALGPHRDEVVRSPPAWPAARSPSRC